MPPEPKIHEKNFSKDLKTFEQLPAETKELELLKDRMEKVSGERKVTLNKMIRDKSQQGDLP